MWIRVDLSREEHTIVDDAQTGVEELLKRLVELIRDYSPTWRRSTAARSPSGTGRRVSVVVAAVRRCSLRRWQRGPGRHPKWPGPGHPRRCS